MFTYLTFIVNSLYNNKDPCHTDKSLLFCIIIKTHERIFSGGSASAGSEAKVSRGGISHEYSSPFPVQTCPTAFWTFIVKKKHHFVTFWGFSSQFRSFRHIFVDSLQLIVCF